MMNSQTDRILLYQDIDTYIYTQQGSRQQTQCPPNPTACSYPLEAVHDACLQAVQHTRVAQVASDLALDKHKKRKQQ